MRLASERRKRLCCVVLRSGLREWVSWSVEGAVEMEYAYRIG